MRNKKRICYIDIARAFAMFAIVLSHTLSCSTHTYPIYKILFSFSVPLFFILSGMTFKIKDNETFWNFLKNKFIRIMLPYLFWGLAFLIPYFLFGEQISVELSQSSSFNFGQQMVNVFYGNGTGASLKQNTPLWFLPALFSTEIIYYFIIRILKNRNSKTQISATIVIVGFGFLFSEIILKDFRLPLGLNTALEIGIFFYFGYLIQKVDLSNIIKPFFLKFLVLTVLILAGALLAKFNTNDNVVWSDYSYNNYFLCIFSGLSLALAVILFAKLINKNKILEYVGKNTMSILIFHKVIVIVFQTKLGTVSALLQDSNILLETLVATIISLLAITITIFIGIIIRKISPQLIGEKKS